MLTTTDIELCTPGETSECGCKWGRHPIYGDVVIEQCELHAAALHEAEEKDREHR